MSVGETRTVTYGVPLVPSRFYSIILTRGNTKAQRRKHETIKTKTRRRKRENTIINDLKVVRVSVFVLVFTKEVVALSEHRNTRDI